MPSLNTPVQRLKVAILPLDVPCSGRVTHSREILTTGNFHGKKPGRFCLNGYMDVENKLGLERGVLEGRRERRRVGQNMQRGILEGRERKKNI